MNKVALYATMILTSGAVFGAEGDSASVPSRYREGITVQSSPMTVLFTKREALESVTALLKLAASDTAGDKLTEVARNAANSLVHTTLRLGKEFKPDELVKDFLEEYRVADHSAYVEHDGKPVKLNPTSKLGTVLTYPQVLVVRP
jgi:hypothetical protein